MPRPPSMPKPRLRKGAKTYEIRVRVPEAARGDRFKGTHTTRTLSLPGRRADNEKDAYRNLTEVHDALSLEFELEAQRLRGDDGASPARVDAPVVAPSQQAPNETRELTIPELCRHYRIYILRQERKRRDVQIMLHKTVPQVRYNPVELAVRHTHHIAWRRKQADAYRINGDFAPYEAILDQLEAEGWRVGDRRRALRALCRTELEALAVIDRWDRRLGRTPSAKPCESTPKREPRAAREPPAKATVNCTGFAGGVFV
jgi:hypothetical protein